MERQRTDLDLVDPGNTGLGHKQVQRWNLPEGWVISRHRAHSALVSDRGTSHGHIVAQLRSHAADRATLGLPRPGIFVHSRMPDGVRHPDGGTNRRSRRNPGQDDPDAADVLDLDSGPGTDTSLDHLTVWNPARGHARERCGEADPRSPDPKGAG